jgi:hypothetical protein
VNNSTSTGWRACAGLDWTPCEALPFAAVVDRVPRQHTSRMPGSNPEMEIRRNRRPGPALVWVLIDIFNGASQLLIQFDKLSAPTNQFFKGNLAP